MRAWGTSQGDAWRGGWAALPHGTERLRFVATSGPHWQSDVGLDDLVVTQTTPAPTPAPTDAAGVGPVGVGFRVRHVVDLGPFASPQAVADEVGPRRSS